MAFLNHRIKTLGTAIFSNDSRNILKFPTCLIKVLEADTKGNVWFIIRKPFDDISDFDQNCPAGLQFYNKKINYYITLSGIATIMADKKEDREILMKFRTLTATCYYCKRKSSMRLINRVINLINNYFATKSPLHLPRSLVRNPSFLNTGNGGHQP
jgi:hypothetical protein